MTLFEAHFLLQLGPIFVGSILDFGKIYQADFRVKTASVFGG